ncbi:hypothetical protein, conserved [Eimeria brunetti]|uniref:Uncharacterized protein n=1 Tax=Eimeria brunetti TaxID=51314 RepID=U6M1Y6_9EIME|nr:hypothetical protein, conserved [Eimeria brunetti]
MRAADLKDKLNYKFGDTPAAFWMKFETFLEVFTDICFCHSLPPQQRAPLPPALQTPRPALLEAAAFSSQTHAPGEAAAADWGAQGAKREAPLPRPLQSEVWTYADGAEVYVTTQGDSWRGLSLCGLPREWSRSHSAGAAAFTPQQTPRSNARGSNATSSNPSAFTASRGPFSGASYNTWGLQQLETGPAAAVQAGRKGPSSTLTGPPPASAPAAAAAAPPQLNRNSSVRGCIYTAVSRPSAFVRYERQAEGFDTAWINAPMFLVSVPPPSSSAAAAAAAFAAAAGPAAAPASAADGGDDSMHLHTEHLQQQTGEGLEQQQVLQQANEKQQQQQQHPQQVDILLSITQDCNLDVAPISMAVFRSRDCRRIWSHADAKLLGISQAVADGERPACKDPWKGGCCRLSKCMQGVLLYVERLPPPQHYEFSGVWTRSTAGGRLLTFGGNRGAAFNSKWPTNPQYAVYANPRSTETTICVAVTRQKPRRKNEQPSHVGLVVALMRDPKDADDLEEALAAAFFQPTEADWLGVAAPPPPPKLYRKLKIEPDEWFVESFGEEKCCVKLSVRSGAGPLIVSPFLETPDTVGSFTLSIFSDLPLQTVEALDSDCHQTFVGRWDAETAGGSYNFPSLLNAHRREATKTTGETPSPNGRKRENSSWSSNPAFHVVVEQTAEVELTLARHDDCWAKQKEQDMAGCMMGLYVFKGKNVCHGQLLQETDFTVGNKISLSVCFACTPGEPPEEYTVVPATWKPGKVGDFFLNFCGPLRGLSITPVTPKDKTPKP